MKLIKPINRPMFTHLRQAIAVVKDWWRDNQVPKDPLTPIVGGTIRIDPLSKKEYLYPAMTKHEMNFHNLVDEWSKATCLHSFWYWKTQDLRYPKILAYGKEAVPYLLRRIMYGGQSFDESMLLAVITEDHPDYEPVVEDRFVKWDVDAVAKAWVVWGKKKGLC